MTTHSGARDRTTKRTATKRDATNRAGTSRWFRRRSTSGAPGHHGSLELDALALAVGHDRADAVRALLTAVTIPEGTTIGQHLRLPRQAFFVLSGRMAINVGDQPVAVLGPGSFFGESDTARMQRRNVPRIHPLGPVVLGVAGPLELPELHRLVPDLPTITTAAPTNLPLGPHTGAASDSTARFAGRDRGDRPDRCDDTDDVMGLGLLDRIAG